MKERLYIPLAFLCLLLFSCAAPLKHYYPASIENLPRVELVELDSEYYPFIEAIDGHAIGSYMPPLFIEPGRHRIVVRPRKRNYELDPVVVDIDADAGEIYELSFHIKWETEQQRSGSLSASADLTGLAEPPPHPVVMRRMGLVYIYRSQRVFGPATDLTFPVYLNGQPLQNLYPGGLCPVLMRPGPAVFSLPGLKEREIRKTWLNVLCHEVPRGYYPLVSDKTLSGPSD